MLRRTFLGSSLALLVAETSVPASAARLLPSADRQRTEAPAGTERSSQLTPEQRAGEVRIKVPLPSNASERRERFRQRNSPQAVQKLCEQFYTVIKPETKGLEAFRRQFEAGRYQQALDAYLVYFADKLRHPKRYGLPTVFYTKGQVESTTIFAPDPAILALERKGVAVQAREAGMLLLGDVGDGMLLLGDVGEPGSVNWTPKDLPYVPPRPDPPQPQLDKLLQVNDFYLALNKLPSRTEKTKKKMKPMGLFPSLLYSYGVSGNLEDLQLWAAYMDDWCANAIEDMNASRANTRAAVELETQMFQQFLQALASVAIRQPGFERDFPSTTLARLLMCQIEQKAPYTIRAKRTEIANWGIFGIANLVLMNRFLPEFKATDYFSRESWRLWSINFIQHRAWDGMNVESQDEGHAYIDIQAFANYLNRELLPDSVSDLEWLEFEDKMRLMIRSIFGEITPSGYKLVLFADMAQFLEKSHMNSVEFRFFHQALKEYHDPVLAEPEIRARLDAVTGDRKGRPKVFSEVSSYMARSYLRSSWKHDGDYLSMWDGKFQALGPNLKTEIYMARGDYMLGYLYPTMVDTKVPYAAYGKVYNPGGKVSYLGEAGRHVVEAHFHTSTRYDLTEAVQDAPYAWHEQLIWNIHKYPLLDKPAIWQRAQSSNPPIQDVTAIRRVFSVRGEGIYIIEDRLQSEGPHEFAQVFYLPTRIARDTKPEVLHKLKASHFPLIEEDEAAQTIRTENLGYPNLTVRLFHQQHLRFANDLDDTPQFRKLQQTAFDDALVEFRKPYKPTAPNRVTSGRAVTALWTAEGDQVLVSLASTRSAGENALEDHSLRDVRPNHGQNGVTGFAATSRSGRNIWFQSGPGARNQLVAGPAQAEAESLLAVADQDELSGIVMGARSLSLRGKTHSISAADFEFSLGPDGSLRVTPIRKPLDTIRILPPENVFVGSTKVSFVTPRGTDSEVEYRYTLDGTDPTIHSPLYVEPFPLDRTAMVKVIGFRKGLAETPYRQCGTDSSAMMTTIFRKEKYRPAVDTNGARPGLRYEYFEDNWPRLFTYTGIPGVLTPKGEGTTAKLLDGNEIAAIRKTEGPYALRYSGYLNAPKDGVYAFYAPQYLYETTADAGFDLRVFLDGEEWWPAPRVHSENTWFIALRGGKHNFSVVFVDFRGQQFRDEYWMSWKPGTVWKGVPVLEVSGPGITRQPLPQHMLFRTNNL